MKHIIIITAILTVLSCKAQSPIIALGDYQTELVNGAYLKDINNDLNFFEGTWKYENDNTSFTISLRKIVQYYNGSWYEDLLIGDYKYVENGIVIANYLPRLTNPSVNDAQHYITGNFIVNKNQVPRCEECDASDRRFKLSFADPERRYIKCQVILRHFIEDSIEKIKIWLYHSDGGMLPYEDTPTVIRVPYGEYVLVKQ